MNELNPLPNIMRAHAVTPWSYSFEVRRADRRFVRVRSSCSAAAAVAMWQPAVFFPELMKIATVSFRFSRDCCQLFLLLRIVWVIEKRAVVDELLLDAGNGLHLALAMVTFFPNCICRRISKGDLAGECVLGDKCPIWTDDLSETKQLLESTYQKVGLEC